MNEGLTSLERHWVINDRILIFGWTIPLNMVLKSVFIYKLEAKAKNLHTNEMQSSRSFEQKCIPED